MNINVMKRSRVDLYYVFDCPWRAETDTDW